MNKFQILSGDIETSVKIINEVGKWCIETNKNMWDLGELTIESLSKNLKSDNFIHGEINKIPVAAMILQWCDPIFWPDINFGESGFIHKLCINPNYSGQGLSRLMINYAKSECIKRQINYLRLDTGWERLKLRNMYEQMGFINVSKHRVGTKDYALYEMLIDL